MARAIVFRSDRRWDTFVSRLQQVGLECSTASFEDPRWSEFDFSAVDLVIYYPAFEFSSNHPLALSRVKDNLAHLNRTYSHLVMYPDPELFDFYNDKYRQALYFRAHRVPTPSTVPLVSEQALERAADELGFPLVLKNRFGAGGDNVELVQDANELRGKFELSRLNYWSVAGLKHVLRSTCDRMFLYNLIRARRMQYPFLSWPLLAQKFVKIDRDLKLVIGDGRAVEGHWRRPADSAMWKMNIDGGAIGEWSHIPRSPIEIGESLARQLNARWINLDLIESDGRFLVTEFSPVWHHYKYREHSSFVYKDDYNISVPLEKSLDLETMIVSSLVDELKRAAAR